MPDFSDLLSSFRLLALATAIGFLAGVERGWKQRLEASGSRIAGLRTFTLIGLLGGLTGLIARVSGEILASALTLAFTALFLAFYARASAHTDDRSATTAVAGLSTFALGIYTCLGDPRLAAAAGVAMVCVLAFKEALHGWVRALTWKEIRSALLILASTFIALPLLPNQPVDPLGAVNPRSLWLLTLMVAGASFAGYVALRTLGPRTGVALAAIAGSLVSSTAVTVDLSRRLRAREIPLREALSAALIAQSIMMLRVGAFCASLSPNLFMTLIPGLVPSTAVCLLASALIRKASAPAQDPSAGIPYADLVSPLDLREVAKFALLLCALTVLARLTASVFGAAGLTALALTAGLVDVDAVTLSVAGMTAGGLALPAASGAILLAVASNTGFKAGLAALIGGLRLSAPFLAVCAISALAGALSLYAFGT